MQDDLGAAVSRQNSIGLRTIDYSGSFLHTATHDRDTTVAGNSDDGSCERTPRLGLREPGSATTAESAEEKEWSAETEEERPIVLGGAFSNLGPFGGGPCSWSRLKRSWVGNERGSESIGPGFRGGKVEVARKRVRRSEP